MVSLLLVVPVGAPAQNTTYSPYTKEQLKEFNSQPLAPAIAVDEVDGESNPRVPKLDSKYFRQPEGEEQAEVLETGSSDPYTPIVPAFTF
jgi:hypothetical protein